LGHWRRRMTKAPCPLSGAGRLEGAQSRRHNAIPCRLPMPPDLPRPSGIQAQPGTGNKWKCTLEPWRHAEYSARCSQHQVSMRCEAVHICALRSEVIRRCGLFYISDPNGRLPMNLLMITAFAAVALIAAATEMLWSHSIKLSAGRTAMPSLHELDTAACLTKLPIEACEDMWPIATKRQ
jgi:hypothetical protein